jgi:PBSX family phage terminase large subunit
MPNEQNLIPYSRRSKEEARENGRKGGMASGVSRRRKKSIAELAQKIGENPACAEDKAVLKEIGIDGEDATNTAVVVAGVYHRAKAGYIDAVEKWEQYTRMAGTDQADAEIDAACSTAFKQFYKNVGKAFYDVAGHVLAHSFTHFDESGGRGSMKSSFVSLAVALLVMSSPSHDMHALVLRKVANTLRDSVYAQYMWAIEKLGVAEHWEAKKTPMELIFKPTGQKIMFRGADDPMKIKSIKVPFGYIAITHFEEKDQFAGRAEIRNILQSTQRGGSVFWNFESYNPPISRDNWANKDSVEDRPDRFCHKSTYLEVQNRDWLGEQFLNEAEHLKATNERAYQHEYLGVPVGSGGNVFELLEVREISDAEVERMDRIYQGVDFGWYPDQFAFLRTYFDSAHDTIYLIDELYVNKWSNEQTGEWIRGKGYTDYNITCDSAEPKSVNDYKDMGIPARAAVKGPGSVEYGFKWLQRRKLVIDPRRTPNAHREIAEYEYERDREGNIISGYPDKNDHAISALRYAYEPLFNRRGNKA